MDSIEVVRVWTYLAPNAGTVRRIANYLSFMVSAVLAARGLDRPDVVVATSPQFFCGWAGVLVSRMKRRPFVLEIRDIWPESIETVGAIRFRPVLRFLSWLERKMYRAAHHIVTVGEGYRDNLLTKVPPGKPITVIPNGVDLERFNLKLTNGQLRSQWGLEGKFVCGYVGTIGMAHGLEVVLEAADLLRQSGRDDITFLLVGDGAERARLERLAREKGLERRVVFTGRLPKEQMPEVIASCDCCLVHLRKTELFQTVLPSKLFEIMAMERPIILGVRGQAQRILEEAQAGLLMEPDCARSLVDRVVYLAENRELCLRLSASARQYVAQHYPRDVLAERMLEVLKRVAAGNRLSTIADRSLQGSAEGASR